MTWLISAAFTNGAACTPARAELPTAKMLAHKMAIWRMLATYVTKPRKQQIRCLECNEIALTMDLLVCSLAYTSPPNVAKPNRGWFLAKQPGRGAFQRPSLRCPNRTPGLCRA